MTTINTREVLFRAVRGDTRWQLGRLDGKYCWWSHTTQQNTNYKYVRTYQDILNLVEWFTNQGFEVTEVTK
jgi:hypothetical protein